MQPRFLHSAGFRRWAGPLIADEMHLIERLERQRHATGRIRAYVADPIPKPPPPPPPQAPPCGAEGVEKLRKISVLSKDDAL